MKSVRFSKVVEKSGKPEVYLLMSETDPEFHKALEADRIMSLSDESHGSGTEYGTVGYDKKRHGQLLLFPKSLKTFADAKVVGIKYGMFAEIKDSDEEPTERKPKKQSRRAKEVHATVKPKAKRAEVKSSKTRSDAKSDPKKLIPFPAKQDDEDDDDEWKGHVRQAMRALEKGNSVAAYNILKRIVL